MRDKPNEISQESLGSVRVAVPSPTPSTKVAGRGGYGLERNIAIFFLSTPPRSW